MRLRASAVRTALIGGLLIVGGTAAPAAAQENPLTTSVDLRMGRRVFLSQCGRCHGLDGTGGGETGAPDLTTGTFATASTDAGLFNVIREGIDGTAMMGISPQAPDQTVWQIITYIHSLNLDPADYDLPGSPSAGRQVFDGKGNCASCHMVGGEGGRLGPDLSVVANRRDPDELKADLLDPNEEVAPRWWTLRVTQHDGTVVEGLRMNEDTFTLSMMDEDENLWHFSKSQISGSDRITTSSMPSYENTLTTGEVDDLVAYLFSLRKERR